MQSLRNVREYVAASQINRWNGHRSIERRKLKEIEAKLHKHAERGNRFGIHSNCLKY